MAIRYHRKQALFEGEAGVEAAEGLAQWLQAQRRPTVHLAGCTHLHAAVLQVLLALRPRVATAPADPWLAAALDHHD